MLFLGRRGVGKSTLIRRAVGILRDTAAILAVVDVQAYSTLTGAELQRQILQDVVSALVEDAKRVSTEFKLNIETQRLLTIITDLAAGETSISATTQDQDRASKSRTLPYTQS
jgi:GTPase SAR1 family protein